MSKELYYYNTNNNKIETIKSYIQFNISTGNNNLNNELKNKLENLFLLSKIYPSKYVINNNNNNAVFYFENKNLCENMNNIKQFNTPNEIIKIINK